MARAKKCDICARFYDSYTEKFDEETEVNSVCLSHEHMEQIIKYKRFDLCPACMSAFIDFVEGRIV